MARLPASLVLAAALAACAHTAVPERERLHVALGYSNAPRQLATSVWVAPFFRDASRWLLTLDPPAETALLVTPRGEPILPGPALEVLPAGTKVRVVAVGFPTAWEAFSRPLLTPRDRVWVELALDGRPTAPSYVFVLPPAFESGEAVAAAIDGLLTRDDLATEVAALPRADWTLVQSKRLATGVSSRALALAFGKPLMRRVYGDGIGMIEEWVWASDAARRTAFLRDGVVTRVDLPERPAPVVQARR